MVGILYFSSTGNSLQIAKDIKEKLGGKILYIPSYKNDGSEFEKIIIVTPIYSFGMPTCVYNLLPTLNKTTELIVVQNYGGMVGGADYLMFEYASELGLNIKSIYTIKMPENFTLTFTVPKFYLKQVLKQSKGKIEKVANDILNGNYTLPKKKKTKKQLYLKNKSNWHLIGEAFSTNNNCTKCKKCIELCPAKNIYFENNEIKFSNKCQACLGCYHRCPNKAIVYKNKNKKSRYINPFINENEIGKNIE